MKINDLINVASKFRFEAYASFNEGLQHEILVCYIGKYKGEVIDIYYDWETGLVNKIEYSTQFIGQLPNFKFNNI